MTNYREILRLKNLGFSKRGIASCVSCSRNTVAKALKRADELGIHWPLEMDQTNAVLEKLFYPRQKQNPTKKRIPDYDYIRRELLKNGVSKKLLWTEYMEDCRLIGESPLMYSQFCHYIQQDEQKRRATMHIDRKPGEQIEVDWAGDPANIIDPDTGEITKVYIFVGVLSYSQYAYAEAFVDLKQNAWIRAHIHMFEYFNGVARILVSDNCKTAVDRPKSWQEDPKLNKTYHEMAEHYNTAILPARVRKPKDKPLVEGAVGGISTWITAALRNEQFFSLHEINQAIRKRLITFNEKSFQKKEGSRSSIYHQEELPLLMPLPLSAYEPAEWKQATVQFNYHIVVEGMYYSVSSEYIKRKVDVRITDTMIEIFYNHHRIASHPRLYGRKNQYHTIVEHMPLDHRQYLEWNGDRFRRWASSIGKSTEIVIDGILSSRRVEQQSYKSCMGLLKLADKYSDALLEKACERALHYTGTPSYKSIRNLLITIKDNDSAETKSERSSENNHGITRGADYYGGRSHDE